jgi:5-methylcytosine-specific restriction endonuclease McrA
MPTRCCLEPTCPNPATWRGRCQIHNRSNERTIQRAGHSIYRTERWRRTREAYLFKHPLCECGCGDIATDVHHLTDLDDGGDPWAFTNLQALTHACHSRITRQRQ